jgi:hypothetical protein
VRRKEREFTFASRKDSLPKLKLCFWQENPDRKEDKIGSR